MIIKEIFYGIKCDRCGCYNESGDYKFYMEESQAVENAMDDEWNTTIQDNHYCPNCYTINEDTEEITIKPPFPESVKRIEKFIDTITRNCAEVYEKEDRFEIEFNEHFPLDTAAQNWITTSYPVAIERIPLRRGNKILITIRK